MSFQFFALHLCPTLVAALDLYISTAFVRVKVGLETAQFSHPLTAQSLHGASNFKVIDFTFESFVENMIEVPFTAVWACFLLPVEPVLEVGPTEVLSTADGEVRVAENLCSDIAMEFIRDWLGECEVISTILSLVRDVCYCHFEFVRIESVMCGDRKNDN